MLSKGDPTLWSNKKVAETENHKISGIKRNQEVDERRTTIPSGNRESLYLICQIEVRNVLRPNIFKQQKTIANIKNYCCRDGKPQDFRPQTFKLN